jgi:hypothetical protein
VSRYDWGTTWLSEACTRTQECWELLDEIKASERRVRQLHDVIHSYRSRLTRVELENRKLRFQRGKLSGECKNLRAQLAEERSRYTLGGTPPGYHEPGAWANRAQPPPSASDKNAPPLKRGLS